MKMKTHCSALFCGLFLVASSSLPLFGESPSLEERASNERERQLMLSYYPAPFVEEVLRDHNIDEKSTQEIVHELQNQDERILQTVDEKLQKLQSADGEHSAPFFQLREEEVRAMHDTLEELFISTLEQHHVADAALSAKMFEEIQRKKAELFARAIRKSR